MGCTAIRSARTEFGFEALLMTAAVRSVSTNEGQMAFTRICSWPWSIAMHLVSKTTAPLEGAYEARLRAPLISSFSHRGKHGAGEQPKPTNIHIEGLVPLLFRDLLGSSNVKDSRIVQQNIEAAEMCHGLLDDVGNFVLRRHIRHQDESRVADLSRRFF
jgi:hypothetical protein